MGSVSATPEDLDDYAALAADSSVTSSKPWLLEFKSQVLRKYAVIVAFIVMAIHIFMAIVLVKGGNTGVTLSSIDQWAFVGIGIIFSALILFNFFRPRLRVNEDGVEVRNFLGPQFYPWDTIYGLSFPQGTRWARLELPEFEFIPVWALQIADKKTIKHDVEEFRKLEDRYMPDE